MKIEIDQSGKVEQTSKDTVLCLSNDHWDAVVIKAATKRQIQEVFRRHGQIKNYVIFTFCAGLSLLIKRNLKIDKIIIDREYFGKEPIIKEIILKMLGKKGKIPEIIFGNIGRRVMAHSRAYKIYSKRLKAKAVLTFVEILEEISRAFLRIKKTEVGKRLKNA